MGDDQYGEDPTTNLLQERLAALLGKDAALWMPSGTMANQVAVMTLARAGDEVITAREAHAGWHEVGAAAANAGVQIVEVGTAGTFTREQFEAAIKPAGLPVFPATTVVEIENTHNRAGGIVFPQDEVVRICAFARERSIASFLDGARLWNAAMASGRSETELAAPFDMVSVSFSKGLGAPAGSVLAGPRDSITRASRFRRRLGGAMRQVGILAAAALHGLDEHRARLVDDHANARRFAHKHRELRRGATRPRERADEHRRLPSEAWRTGCCDGRGAGAAARRAARRIWPAHGARGHSPGRVRPHVRRGGVAPRVTAGLTGGECGTTAEVAIVHLSLPNGCVVTS